MTPEQQAAIREAVARAVFDAENGIDGDQIGDMLYDDFRITGEAEEAKEQTMNVCRRAADAAIAAYLKALEAAGFVPAPWRRCRGKRISSRPG